MASMNSTFRRTRKVTHERLVPHTINGLTKMVTEKYTVDEPLPPRDWDLAVRNAVTAATAITVAGSIAWSTDSIGSLLGRTVNPAIAYTAAAVFDLAWVTCMALEWLARYDRRKASLPRKLGYVALIIAMLSVATNGWLAGGDGAFLVGLIGAFVSAIAKGMWTMTMRTFGSTLDDRSQQWVEARFSDVQARLATAAATRELARVEGAIAGYEDTLGTSAALPQTEEESASVLAAADSTVRAAIAIARHTLGPDVTPAQIAAQLVLTKVLPDPESAARVVLEHMVRDGAHHGAPQVSPTPKSTAITTIAEWCGEGAPSDLIVQILAHQGVEVTDSQVRNELSRARKKAPAKTTFGFGKP